MNVITLWWRRHRTLFVGLEGDDFKGHTQHFCHFFTEFAVGIHIVDCPAQAASDHLLAQQLRHEGTQSDDVCNGIAVPSFRKHPHAHDAAHVPTRRCQRSTELPGQCLEVFWINGPILLICRPVLSADGIEGEAHPTGFIALGFPGVGLVDHL